MTRYVALLRGINVGGKNLIKMAALKTCFEHDGFEEVGTYIQSGNVIFTGPDGERKKLEQRIEKVLGATFDYRATVVVRSLKEMKHTVEKAPPGFGEEPQKYRYDVIFLKEPLDAKEALKTVPIKEGVDEVAAGKGVLYFSRLEAKASQSRLSKVVSLPIYQSMTIRNWNTTTKLLQLLQA